MRNTAFHLMGLRPPLTGRTMLAALAALAAGLSPVPLASAAGPETDYSCLYACVNSGSSSAACRQNCLIAPTPATPSSALNKRSQYDQFNAPVPLELYVPPPPPSQPPAGQAMSGQAMSGQSMPGLSQMGQAQQGQTAAGAAGTQGPAVFTPLAPAAGPAQALPLGLKKECLDACYQSKATYRYCAQRCS